MLTKIKDKEGNEFKVHGYGLKALNNALKEARFDGKLDGDKTVNEIATMKLYLSRVSGFMDPYVRKHMKIIHGFISFLRGAIKHGEGVTLEQNKMKAEDEAPQGG